MNAGVYQYQLARNVSGAVAEELLLLAVVAVECLRGDSVVRLDASYRLDSKKGICIVDASSEVGHAIARIFTGFLTREFGEDGFKVKKVVPTGGESVTLQDLTYWMDRRGPSVQ